jgi:hypothetical protein
LEDIAERCPVIPEQEEFSLEIRHLIYFSHRIVFSVEREKKRVVIYRVYHGSRQRLAEDDLA